MRESTPSEEAEEMHQQSLELRETVLSQEHPRTLMSMSNLADVLKDQGKYEQAEEMLRQALELQETVLGQEHPDSGSPKRGLIGLKPKSNVAV
jgi:tetratricopeptide (TPR) repeat protein